jgi:hypothetical protein
VARFDRRIADYTCYFDSTGVFQVAPAPGTSVSTPFQIGTPAADAYPGTFFIPFATDMTLGSLINTGPIGNMYRQFRLDSCTWTFAAMQVGSVDPGNNESAVIPEVLIATDTTTITSLTTVGQYLAYTDTKRLLLSGVREKSFRCQLRPIVSLTDGSAIPDKTTEFWYLTNQPGCDFAGAVFCLRNMSSPVAAPGPAVRITATVRVSCRMPHG